MRIRQVALVARELGPVAADLDRELGLTPCFRDPEVAYFGLENALFRIGDTFLEVVAPVEDGTTAGRLLAKRGGDGGYMVMAQAADATEHRAALVRAAEAGVRTVFEVDLEDITDVHLHPRDLGGTILALDRADPPSSWRWAGPSWSDVETPAPLVGITAVELQATDPRPMAERWGGVLGVDAAGDPPTLGLDDGTIRFVEATDGRGDGLGGLDLATTAGEERRLELCGTRVRLVPHR